MMTEKILLAVKGFRPDVINMESGMSLTTGAQKVTRPSSKADHQTHFGLA